MQRLIFDQDYALPPERVFEYFAEHENLAAVFGAKITRLKNGTDGNRNGVGSVRELKVGPAPPFEETVTAYREHQLIEYEITKGTPLNEQHGAMRFSRRESGHASHLEYEIRLGSDIPGVAKVVARVLTKRISRGLARLDADLVAQGGAADQVAATMTGSRLGLVEPPAGSDVTST